MQEILNPIHRQNYPISKGLSNFKPKSNSFMRETVVRRILFFLDFFMLHEVYTKILQNVTSAKISVWL